MNVTYANLLSPRKSLFFVSRLGIVFLEQKSGNFEWLLKRENFFHSRRFTWRNALRNISSGRGVVEDALGGRKFHQCSQNVILLRLVPLGEHGKGYMVCMNNCRSSLRKDANPFLRVAIFTARKMFLYLSVILFTGGSLSRGVLVQRGISVSGGLCPTGGLCPVGGFCRGGSLSGRPPATIRLCAGGTHPTGMHSCCIMVVFFKYLDK